MVPKFHAQLYITLLITVLIIAINNNKYLSQVCFIYTRGTEVVSVLHTAKFLHSSLMSSTKKKKKGIQ